MNISRYSSYSNNMNMSKIVVDEEKCKNVMSKFLSRYDEKSAYLLKEIMTEELKDYRKIKNKDRSVVKGWRKITIGPLVGDKHGLLISTGSCITGYKKLHIINLINRLDIILSACFNIEISEVQSKLKDIADKYSITIEYLSMLTLSLFCPDNIMEESDIIAEDFCIFSEVKDFMLEVIKEKMSNNRDVLSNISGFDFSELVKVTDEEDEFSGLPMALILKLLITASTITKSIVVEFYRRGIKGLILSQDFCSVTIGSEQNIEKFIFYGDKYNYLLPMEVIKC